MNCGKYTSEAQMSSTLVAMSSKWSLIAVLLLAAIIGFEGTVCMCGVKCNHVFQS